MDWPRAEGAAISCIDRVTGSILDVKRGPYQV